MAHPFILPVESDASFDALARPLLNNPHSFCMEVAHFGSETPRYVVVGNSPISTFESHEGFLTINGLKKIGSPVDGLKEFASQMNEWPVDPYQPLAGLMMGFVSFEWANPNRLATTNDLDPTQLPDSWFGCFDTLFVYDKLDDRKWIASLGIDETPKQKAFALMDLIEKGDEDIAVTSTGVAPCQPIDESEFREVAEEIKSALKHHPYWSVNLPCRFSTLFNEAPFALFDRCKTYSRSEFSTLLNLDHVSVMTHPKAPMIQQFQMSSDETRFSRVIDQLHHLIPMPALTGVPKRNMVNMLNTVERSRRNLYTGSVGCITPAGSAQFTPGVRALSLKDNIGYVYSGSWISHDTVVDTAYSKCVEAVATLSNYLWKV